MPLGVGYCECLLAGLVNWDTGKSVITREASYKCAFYSQKQEVVITKGFAYFCTVAFVFLQFKYIYFVMVCIQH